MDKENQWATLAMLSATEQTHVLWRLNPLQQAAALAGMSAARQAAVIGLMAQAMTLKEQASALANMTPQDRSAALEAMNSVQRSKVILELAAIGAPAVRVFPTISGNTRNHASMIDTDTTVQNEDQHGTGLYKRSQPRVSFNTTPTVREFHKEADWVEMSFAQMNRILDISLGDAADIRLREQMLSDRCIMSSQQFQQRVFETIGPESWDFICQQLEEEKSEQHHPRAPSQVLEAIDKQQTAAATTTSEPEQYLKVIVDLASFRPSDDSVKIRQHKAAVVDAVTSHFKDPEDKEAANKNANLLVSGDKGLTNTGVCTLETDLGTAAVIFTAKHAYIALIVARVRGLGNGSKLLEQLEQSCIDQTPVKWLTVSLQSCLNKFGDFFSRNGFTSSGSEGEHSQWSKQLRSSISHNQNNTVLPSNLQGCKNVSVVAENCDLTLLKQQQPTAQHLVPSELPTVSASTPSDGSNVLAGMNHQQYTKVLALNEIALTWYRKAALRLLRVWVTKAHQWIPRPFPDPDDVQLMIKAPEGAYAICIKRFIDALSTGVLAVHDERAKALVPKLFMNWVEGMFNDTTQQLGFTINEAEAADELEDIELQTQVERLRLEEALRQQEEEQRLGGELNQQDQQMLGLGPLGYGGPNHPQPGSSRQTAALLPSPKLNYRAREAIARLQDQATGGSVSRVEDGLTVLSTPMNIQVERWAAQLEILVVEAAKSDFEIEIAPFSMEKGPGYRAPKGGGCTLQVEMWSCWNRITVIGNAIPRSAWTAPPPPIDRGRKHENCAGVYDRSSHIAKAIEQANVNDCDGNALSELIKRHQLLLQWEERAERADQAIQTAWASKVITDEFTADAVVKLMAFRMTTVTYNAIQNTREQLRLPQEQKKLYTPRFDRVIPGEHDLPNPDIRKHLKIARQSQTARETSPSPDTDSDSEEKTPNQPPELSTKEPSTSSNNNTTNLRGRGQHSLVQPENIPGHEASNLKCDNGTMWIDTAKAGPTVKRLKLGKEDNDGTSYKGSQQLQEKRGAARKKSQNEKKNTTKDNGSKRVRNETQTTKEPSAREEKQRNMSAKEQLSNPGGKKGTVELLCASAVNCKETHTAVYSQFSPSEVYYGDDASCAGSGSKSGSTAKKYKKQAQRGMLLPDCFTPTSSKFHAKLESKLELLWNWKLPNSPNNPQIFGFSFNALDLLLRECGLLKDTTQPLWIKELGRLRATVSKTKWELLSPETDPSHLIEEAVRDGWITCFPDGSKRELNGKKKCPAGSGVFFPICPGAPVAFATAARRPTSDLAELEAVICARFSAGPKANLLLLPDSAYTSNIVNLLLPSRIGYGKAMANLPAVMIMGFLCTLASGGTHAIRIPSHQGVIYNEIADILAKHGATLTPAHWHGFRDIDWDKLKAFLLDWGRSLETTINHLHKLPVEMRLAKCDLTLHACLQAYKERDPRWIPNCTSIHSNWTKTQEVRELTLPFMRTCNKQLWEIWYRVKEGLCDTDMCSVKSDLVWTIDAQRACLWCAVVKVFGLRKIEIDAQSTKEKRKHTKEFNKRVSQLAKIIDLTNDLDLDITEVDYDVLNISCIRRAIEQKTGLQQPLASTGVALKATALASLIGTEVGIHVADVCALLADATAWAEVETEALQNEIEDDEKRQRALIPTGLWRRNNIKAYLNHVRSRDCTKPLICKVHPADYLQYLVGKVCSIDCSEFDFSWMTQRPTANSHDLQRMANLITKKEILKALLATRSKSAPSPIAQESYASLKMLIEPGVLRAYKKSMKEKAGEAKLVIKAEDSFDVCVWQWDSDIPFQRLFETNRWCEFALDDEGDLDISHVDEGILDMSQRVEGTVDNQDGERRCDPFEGNSSSIHHFIWLVAVIIQKTGWCPQTMNDMCTRVIPKVALETAGAMSPAEFEAVQNDPSKWREVQLCDSMMRKLITNVLKTRIITFITENNRHYGIQAGYLPKVDPSRIAHLKLNIIRTYSEINKCSEIVIPWDLESMFTFIQEHQRERAYNFNGLPDETQNMLRAFQVNKRAFMTKEGTIFKPQPFPGDIMGSSESLADTLLLTAELCAALVHAGVGFKLPNLGRCREVTVSGIMVVDDLTTVHGGGCSAEECIADALKTCEIVCEFAKRYKLFFHGNDDPAKSKTVAIINLFDDQGARIYRDVKLPVFTKQGMKCIPTLQHGKSHKILGVQVHNSHCLTAVTTFHAALDIFEARIKYLMKSDLPCQAMLYSLTVVALGKVNWLLDKGSCIPWAVALDLSKMVAKYSLNIAGVTGAPCCMAFVDTIEGGIGIQDPIRSLMKLALVQVIHDKVAKEDMVRRWSWYELEFARMSNNIPEAESDHQYGFFNWDIRGMSWTAVLDQTIVKHQSVHTWALAAVLRSGCKTGTKEASEGTTVKLGIFDPIKNDENILICSKSKIRCTLQSFFKAETALEFTQSMTGARMLAYDTDKKLSNKWRSSKILSSAAWKFAMKAMTDLCMTPALISGRWKRPGSTACPLCHYQYANLKHITQRCPQMNGMIRFRHNECFPIFAKWLEKCCSDMPYFGGFEKAPPQWMIPADWRRKVEALTPDFETPGTKPDLIIANAVAPGKFKVRIIDFQIAYEDNFEFAKNSKLKHYSALCTVIKSHLLAENNNTTPDVQVVPIIVGARGGIPLGWHNDLALLATTPSYTALLAEQLSAAAIKGSHMIYMSWLKNAYSRGWNKSNR
jgi:hypothetical protein